VLPAFVHPQLSKLVNEPPAGPEWLHEIKFDGYRMHARRDRDDVQHERRAKELNDSLVLADA